MRTLMHALDIHYLELPLTAGLAWLLDPDGWHGLSSHVLSGLLNQLGTSSRRRTPCNRDHRGGSPGLEDAGQLGGPDARHHPAVRGKGLFRRRGQSV